MPAFTTIIADPVLEQILTAIQDVLSQQPNDELRQLIQQLLDFTTNIQRKNAKLTEDYWNKIQEGNKMRDVLNETNEQICELAQVNNRKKANSHTSTLFKPKAKNVQAVVEKQRKGPEKPKIYIIGSSNARDIPQAVSRYTKHKYEVTGTCIPGGEFKTVLNQCRDTCNKLTKKDHLVIFAGYNDIANANFKASTPAQIDLTRVKELAEKTNVILSEIRFDYGRRGHLTNLAIIKQNKEFAEQATNFKILKIFDVPRNKIRKDGVHLTPKGKDEVAREIFGLLQEQGQGSQPTQTLLQPTPSNIVASTPQAPSPKRKPPAPLAINPSSLNLEPTYCLETSADNNENSDHSINSTDLAAPSQCVSPILSPNTEQNGQMTTISAAQHNLQETSRSATSIHSRSPPTATRSAARTPSRPSTSFLGQAKPAISTGKVTSLQPGARVMANKTTIKLLPTTKTTKSISTPTTQSRPVTRSQQK